ncbi:MAG: hypothetical protein CO094_07825 [Anaerolineae bacterium CG_4_9_14_3_um_filter_57_17]|nr:SH3 domain-containing protein [bacterium]NCT19685.1 SH3 domain-containing protein [bacterium]OIO83481.1 MAG: hypothetical protein AUK01_12535 [Anaerolineae bacterium CG2_30_57_67]PJB66201.1 MAG: hypothetical protein CO094_07825 [Anaerolineae bacterium CG_4_9_14_3_um_filter_57_17]
MEPKSDHPFLIALLVVALAVLGISSLLGMDLTKLRTSATYEPKFHVRLYWVDETPVPTSLPTATALPSDGTVCTGQPGGLLNVRQAAGADALIVGSLPEAARVTPTGRQTASAGETWGEISVPLAGWVNLHFLCAVRP